jgi:hypothetical protein
LLTIMSWNFWTAWDVNHNGEISHQTLMGLVRTIWGIRAINQRTGLGPRWALNEKFPYPPNQWV